MYAAFIEKMKDNLLAQKAEILKSLEIQSEDMKSLIKTVESGDEADVASDAIDRTLLNAMGAQDANRLQQINSALDRIKQGRYGFCLECGAEISQPRLEALPYAPLCIDCASASERRN